MDKYKIYFLSFITITLFACSPKVVEIVEAPVLEKPVYEGPCATFNDLNRIDKDEAETAYVLYKDFLRSKEFLEAYKYWTSAMKLAPKSNGKIQYQYEDGLVIYKYFYDNESDEIQKKEWLEKYMSLYDQRVECFGEEAYVAGRKAYDMYYKFKAHYEDQEIYDLFKEAIDAQGKKTGYFVVNPFTKLLVEGLLNESVSQTEAQEYSKKLFDIIDYGNANCEENKICEAWEIINGYSPARLEALEAYDGFYDCEYYTAKYYQEFLDNPEDCDIINSVYSKLRRGQCDENSEVLAEVKSAREALCIKKQVVEEGPLRKAFNAYNEGNYKEAVALFDDFVKRTEDIEKKAKYNLLIAKLYYRDLKNFSQARKYALASAELQPNWGEPYLLIGKLYASSGPLCGPGTGWDSQIVTWPAIDKWQYAVKIDPENSAEAKKLIRTYRQYMPKKEDIFIRNIQKGDAFRVNCWIKENTRVRTAD